MDEKLRILFLCTGNSCRSQMAEGWAKKLKADKIEAYSAGICPIGLSRRAAMTMAEAGVDISNQKSEHLDTYEDIEFDYVVTLCDNAKEMCPVFPGKCKVIHHSFRDPATVGGSEQLVAGEFARIRDQIKEFVEGMPENLQDDGRD